MTNEQLEDFVKLALETGDMWVSTDVWDQLQASSTNRSAGGPLLGTIKVHVSTSLPEGTALTFRNRIEDYKL